MSLRHWRRAAGWTQIDAASALAISLRTYQRLEHGEPGIRDEMGLRRELARLLGERLRRDISAQWDLQPSRPGTRRQSRR